MKILEAVKQDENNKWINGSPSDHGLCDHVLG